MKKNTSSLLRNSRNNSDFRLIDATMRDGGLVNNFYFSDEFVKNLYLSNIESGIEYMEIGYKASNKIFNERKHGKWKFCNEDFIYNIFGDNNTNLKLAVMADVGRCDYKKDIVEKSESIIDLVRVATYIETIPSALKMIENINKKGYETTCNIMAISTANRKTIKNALELLGRSPVDVIYIVDSYGALYPKEIEELSEIYLECADKYGKKIGIHTHNNLQLAFANTITAFNKGVSWLDSTYYGMGRGAGNCSTELLLSFLNNNCKKKYNLLSVIEFIDKNFQEEKIKENIWGYSLQYLFSASLNQHPREAIKFTGNRASDYMSFYKECIDLYEEDINSDCNRVF